MWSNSCRGPAGRLWSPGIVLASFALLLLVPSPGPSAASVELPDSLGQWYKPVNKRQVWLHTMFAMRRELQAVREYAAAGDRRLAAKWSDRLAKHYRSLSQMVPEWQDETEPELLDALQAAVAAGRARGAERAAKRLANSCRACHRQYQALAALRYRWPKFDSIRLSDGQGGERSYADGMQDLSGILNRIKIAADDGRWQAAGEALASLEGELHLLGEGCVACHRDHQPRERILGAQLGGTLAQLEAALQAQDAKTTGRRLGQMGVQTCARCHGVHRLLSGAQRFLFE